MKFIVISHAMWIFIDESGDAGFKITRGSSKHFVTTMVLFRSKDERDRTREAIDALRQELKIHKEFKFSKSCADYKDRFFECVNRFKFTTRSVVVDKERIYSQTLREDKDKFYNYFIGTMISHDNGVLQDARVTIDGSGNREFRREFQAYLKSKTSQGCVKRVVLRESHAEPLIQLADMIAGAIARSCKSDRDDASRWRTQLSRAGKIEDIWNFR